MIATYIREFIVKKITINRNHNNFSIKISRTKKAEISFVSLKNVTNWKQNKNENFRQSFTLEK